MPGPGAHELLEAWGHGLSRSPAHRALSLLAAASPGTPLDDIARLPTGTRDLGLLRLRSELFGDRVEAVCSCPGCGEQLDACFDARDLLPEEITVAASAPAPTRQLSLRGTRVTVRAPSSLDLLAVAGEPDIAASRRALLRRCLANAGPADGTEPAGPLPAEFADDLVEEVVTQIAALDPRARIELDLTCAACGHAWSAVFDIASFLWAEINAWAHRTLRDVHAIAAAYGWREADILALSPLRRQCYLEMVRS
jgi:hypothetical protein